MSDPVTISNIQNAMRAERGVYEIAAWLFHANVKKVRETLYARGITEDAIKHFWLGYDDGTLAERLKHILSVADLKALALVSSYGKDFMDRRLVFPICDTLGGVAGFVGRSLRAEDNTKYLRGRGANRLVFNLPAITSETLYITEGPLDAISLWQAGFDAIGLMGTHLTGHYLEQVKQCKKVVIVLDGDDAGKAGAAELLAQLGSIAEVVELPDGEDVNSLYATDDARRRKLLKLLR